MKKVSVQFNLVVTDDTTHREIKDCLNRWIIFQDLFAALKITSIQINNIEKRGKR